MINHNIAAQTSLVPSVGFPVCPEQEVVLTCTASGGSPLQWRVTTSTEVFIRTYITSTAQTNVVTMLGPFQAVLISTGPLTSTLTTTAQTALDGTEVQCSAPDVETVTVEVISKSILSSQFRAPPVGLFAQLPRLPPPVLPSWWLVRLLAPPQLQLQYSGLPVLELITTLSVSHQTSPHWEDRSPPLTLHWSYKMCLTTLHTLSILWPLTVLVAVLLLRQILTLVSTWV